MLQLLLLQVIALFGAAQISKPLSHLVFVRLCIKIVFPLARIVKCSLQVHVHNENMKKLFRHS